MITRQLVEQVADATLMKFAQQHPEMFSGESKATALTKWVSGVAAALVIGFLLWMASTLSDLQQTVTRIDERQKIADPAQNRRFDDIERRVGVLEGYHHGGRNAN